MLHWYREHIVWTDKALNLKLLRKGILARIDAPMAIVQGLRESGVFSSAIVSAQTRSKEKFLTEKNMRSSNSSAASGVPSKTVEEKVRAKSQAASRKVLEFIDVSEAAIPPLSPPGLDSLHMGT